MIVALTFTTGVIAVILLVRSFGHEWLRAEYVLLVDSDTALEYFERIAPDLYRFPAIDPGTFRRRVEDTFGTGQS